MYLLTISRVKKVFNEPLLTTQQATDAFNLINQRGGNSTAVATEYLRFHAK